MKRTAWILAVAACLTACGGAPTTAELAIDEPDAAPPAVTSDSGGSQRDGGAPEAQVTTPEASPVVDAGRGADSSPSAPDAAPPSPDAPAVNVDARVADGGSDGAPWGDAAALILVNRAIDYVHAQFPPALYPCAPDGDRKCGGVRGAEAVVTLPLVCQAGAWELAATWDASSGTVVWLYTTCSRVCAEGRLCTP